MNELNKNLERKIDERTLALKNALYEKDRSQEQLIRAESLAAIGQLVAGTAHELNNPLASVISILQSSIEDLNALDVKTQLENDFFEDLKFSEQELKRAKSIVDSLLGLSRQTQSYSEPVNINNVIKDSLKMLNNQFKNDKLTIAQNYATNLPLIKGNFSNLGQVAINIIKNAIQAIKKTEGEIILNTRHDKDKNHVVFECIDTGPGVLKSRRQDIFKPFFTTKPAGEGTGLGLYICHEIVKRHGGTIELEDNNGKGAKFVVNLPLDNEC
jgi:two-component system NtrC family sensor kinase